VNDDVASVERASRRVVVHDVTLDEMQVRMAVEVRELNGVPVQVVVDDDLVVFDQVLHEVGADEAGAACDADPFTRKTHARAPLAADGAALFSSDGRRAPRSSAGDGIGHLLGRFV
jgi:hypothetical protein